MNDSIASTDPQAGRLIAIQQTLLSCGYKYVDGSLDNWPMNMVLMSHDNSAVLVGPWRTEYGPGLSVNFNQFARQNPSSGLLLVGGADPQSREIQDFLAATDGCVAYIDANTSQVALRGKGASMLNRPPAIFSKDGLRMLLQPPAPAAARIDARAELEKALSDMRQTREFQDRSAQAGGARKPAVVTAIMVICIGVFALQFVLGDAYRSIMNAFDLSGPPVRDGQWWRLVTAGFLHVNMMHIFFNMMAMYYIGRPLEAFQGRWRLAVYFLFTVITGNLLSLWWDPMVNSVGASGGLFGLVGAMAALALRYRRDFPPAVWQGLKKWLITILMYNAIFFVVPNINGSAHVGGLIGGFLLGMVIACSPTAPKPLTPLARSAVALLLALTAIFGSYAIQTIPAANRPQTSRKQQIVNDVKKWFLSATKKQPATNGTDE